MKGIFRVPFVESGSFSRPARLILFVSQSRPRSPRRTFKAPSPSFLRKRRKLKNATGSANACWIPSPLKFARPQVARAGSRSIHRAVWCARSPRRPSPEKRKRTPATVHVRSCQGVKVSKSFSGTVTKAHEGTYKPSPGGHFKKIPYRGGVFCHNSRVFCHLPSPLHYEERSMI